MVRGDEQEDLLKHGDAHRLPVDTRPVHRVVQSKEILHILLLACEELLWSVERQPQELEERLCRVLIVSFQARLVELPNHHAMKD